MDNNNIYVDENSPRKLFNIHGLPMTVIHSLFVELLSLKASKGASRPRNICRRHCCQQNVTKCFRQCFRHKLKSRAFRPD